MPDGKTMLILAVIAGALYAGDKTVHGVKKVNRKVCNFVTFHHKCKPVSPVPTPVDPASIPTKD